MPSAVARAAPSPASLDSLAISSANTFAASSPTLLLILASSSIVLGPMPPVLNADRAAFIIAAYEVCPNCIAACALSGTNLSKGTVGVVGGPSGIGGVYQLSVGVPPICCS